MVFMDNFVHCDLHPGNIINTKYMSISDIAGVSTKISEVVDNAFPISTKGKKIIRLVPICIALY